MTATMVPAGAAVDAVRVGVDGLLSAELTSLFWTELTGLAADFNPSVGDFRNYFPMTFLARPELSYPCFRFGS